MLSVIILKLGLEQARRGDTLTVSSCLQEVVGFSPAGRGRVSAK